MQGDTSSISHFVAYFAKYSVVTITQRYDLVQCLSKSERPGLTLRSQKFRLSAVFNTFCL